MCVRVFRELTFGIPVLTKDGQRVGESKTAAKQAIAQVVVSRIFMASPGMCKWLINYDIVLHQIVRCVLL